MMVKVKELFFLSIALSCDIYCSMFVVATEANVNYPLGTDN